MDHQKEQERSSAWLKHVKEGASLSIQGRFETTQDLGNEVILEWALTDILSLQLALFKQSVSALACDIFAPIEAQFLRAHPGAVSQELFLKSCAPLFEKGAEAVDWTLVEETIKSTIKQFYLLDLSKFPPEVIKPLLDDLYFFAVARDRRTKKIIGFLMSSITPALPDGNVKVINVGWVPEENSSGLDKLLLSAIFKVIPDVKRLFLYVRPTNENHLNAYQAMGFSVDRHPSHDPNHKINLDYLVPLEYNTGDSEVLQNLASSMKSG